MISLIVANIRASYRTVPVVMTWISLTVFLGAIVVIVGSRVVIAPTLAGELEVANLPGYLTLLTYGAVFIATGLNLNVFTAQPMIRDKKKHVLESVLATPVSIRRVWTARSLSVYLPGLLSGTTAGIISLAIWQAQLAGGLSSGATPNDVMVAGSAVSILGIHGIVSAFVTVPVLYLVLAFLVQLVGLGANAVTGNVIAQLSLQAVVITMVNLAMHRVVKPDSLLFILIHLGMATAGLVAVVSALGILTKERVVLSAGVEARAGAGA